MNWNYRIILHDTVTTPYATIHEVYYDKKGEITSWTTEPISIVGEDSKDVISILKTITIDLEQPELKESELARSLKIKVD